MPAMSEAAIKQAALEAGAGSVHRVDGDFWTDGSVNLSKFVRFLARQPHVVSEPTLDVTPVYATDLEAKMDAEIRQLRRPQAALREIARQKTTNELSEEEHEGADFEEAYDTLIRQARAALAP
jgi:hypothetical protein